MRPLSAIDAIEPAWKHTRRLLIAPRNWRLLLKIGAVAFFAQVGCSSSFNFPGHRLNGLPPAFSAAVVAAAVVAGIVALVIGLAFFYLGSRLQFVLFEVVLRSDTAVTPIWRRYGRATWHWIGLKILFFLIALVCAAPVLVPVILHFIRSFRGAFHGGSPQNPVALVMTILGFVGATLFIVLVIGICYTLLLDFGLPSMALESTPMSVTVRRVWNLLRGEPGPVALYLLMRFLLGIAGSLIADVVLVAGALIVLIPLGGASLLAWMSLHQAGFAGHVVMIAAWVVLAVVFAALLMVAAVMMIGYLFTFLQAYALYFLGGRYALVGEYLAPFLPPPYPYSGAQPMYPPPPSPLATGGEPSA